MTGDLRALLAAIVADPEDDTARLVYADCLQEQGNTSRADFIRFQVEAERLHPDSSARATLEARAEALLEEHWIEWKGEVCAAVGLPKPISQPRGRIARMVRRVPLLNSPGHPYRRDHFFVSLRDNLYKPQRMAGWVRTTFHRGFPDSVAVYLPLANPNREFLPHWQKVAPLATLYAYAPYTEAWIDGPHLNGLQSLTLADFDPVALHGTLASPHLSRLEALTLSLMEYGGGDTADLADVLASALTFPRIRQLKRLSLPVWSDRAAEAVASAENLVGLEALEVQLHSPMLDAEMLLDSNDLADAGRRLATLARSHHLAGLRELKIVGEFDSAGLESVIRDPTWKGLRKLELQGFLPDLHELLIGADDLPELDELRLYGVTYSVAQVEAFARSPLLKRLRHLAVRGGPHRSVDFDIAHAVDPDRIETFAIGEQETSPRAVAMLRDHFGDRFRLLQ